MTAEIKIDSLDGFVKDVLSLRDRWAEGSSGEPELWFRGAKRASLKLVPGAYWRKECDEQSLFLSFKTSAPSYVTNRPATDWEWYFLAQHYGLPTRLLDWTESSLTALYFALTLPGGKCVDADPNDSPVVWAMDPSHLNQATHSLQDAYLFIPDEKRLINWLPHACGRGKPALPFDEDPDFKDNSKPVAIFPTRHNPRLVAQRGVFTVHGTEETPIDEVFVNALSDGAPRIAKFLIDPHVCPKLLRDLTALGIDQTALFPEPASLAVDLMRMYGVK